MSCSRKELLYELSSESEGDDNDDHLEVLPPSAASRESSEACSSASAARPGPQPSSNGCSLADPIALLDEDDSDHEKNVATVASGNLQSTRLEQESCSITAVRENQKHPRRNYQDIMWSDSDSDESFLHHRPIANVHSQASRRTQPSYGDISSDSDDTSSSEDSLTQRIKLFSKSKTASEVRTAAERDSRLLQSSVRSSGSSQPPVSTTSKRKQHLAAEREERQRMKEAEHLQKQQEREHTKAMKEQRKLAEKRARNAKLEAEKAEKRYRQELKTDIKAKKGGFANREIAVLADTDLFRHPELTITDELQDRKYHVIEHASMLGCKAIQYIRKDWNGGKGGAEAAVAAMRAGECDNFEHLPVVGIVFDDANEFLKLLERDDTDEDDYPRLDEWLRAVEVGWRVAWRYGTAKKPRFILYLFRVAQSLEELWIKHKRSKQPNSAAPPSDEELKDAIAWLLVQFQVECVECRDNDHLALDIISLTRKLSDRQYQKTYTGLDVSQKLASLCGIDASLYAQAQDCWLRQVQQIPRVSFNMARTLVQHYPTGYSLWRVYQDPSLTEDEKRSLLVDCFGSKAHAKLSDQVYCLLTSDNPNFLLV